MSEFVVHSIPGSPYGRATLVALEEKGAPFRFAKVAPGTLKSPEHLAVHPFGRVPVLVHGGFRVYETQAILRYIDRVVSGPSLVPASPQAAARVDQLMNINDCYLFQGVSNVIIFQRIIGPRLLGSTPDEAAIAATMPKARAVFKELASLLGEQRFLAGETFSLADVLIAPQLDFMVETPEWQPLTAELPNLREWLARVTARPSFVATTWERVAALASQSAAA